MERIVKGIWIPLEIWQTTDLNWNEKILLMEIDSFTSAGRDCYFSNEYIANLLGVTERYASKCLSNLIEAGYVRLVRFDGRKRYVESEQKFQAGWNNSSRQSGTKVPHTNIDDLNKNIDNIERDNKGRSRFQKPTLEEVTEYCRTRNNGIDPEEFFAFYESKGWMVGKNPMKDWKAAVITWEKSAKKKSSSQRQYQPRRRETTFEHNLRAIDQVMGSNLHEQYYGRRDYDEQ